MQADVLDVPFGETTVAEHAGGFVGTDFGQEAEKVFAGADGQCRADGAVVTADDFGHAARGEIGVAVVALFLQEFEHPDVDAGRAVGAEMVEIGFGERRVGLLALGVGHGQEERAVRNWARGK